MLLKKGDAVPLCAYVFLHAVEGLCIFSNYSTTQTNKQALSQNASDTFTLRIYVSCRFYWLKMSLYRSQCFNMLDIAINVRQHIFFVVCFNIIFFALIIIKIFFVSIVCTTTILLLQQKQQKQHFCFLCDIGSSESIAV